MAAASASQTQFPPIRVQEMKINALITEVQLLRHDNETVKMTVAVMRDQITLLQREVDKLKRMKADKPRPAKAAAPALQRNPRYRQVIRDSLIPVERPQ